ncbi:MAG: LysE family translocator [candidate division KSB1 bacterium]|jgi:threonine/homoserine/homoserine lactone efflux protein|nr:LysE family translocator [candidate division KSB1 bacterium]
MSYLITGMVFGLSGGLSPGPLLALVISESLRYGVKSGIKVAIAPVLTDLPIVLSTIYIVSKVSGADTILGILSLAGSAFIFYLAWESLTFKGTVIEVNGAKPQSLRKGVIANVLNPHPYLFWMSVGAPTIIRAAESSTVYIVFFVSGLYVCLLGTKISVALIVGKSRRFLKSDIYIYLMRFMGVVLLAFALIFLREGISLLGLL